MTTALESIGQVERSLTLADKVHAELCDLLMAGRLSPGEKLSLRRVAGTLGVSMMPVREAVTRLVAEEALAVTPNRAVSVPLVSRARLRELTTIRCEIEGFAAAEAARRRTPADLETIRELDARFRASAATASAEEALHVNKDLHFAIYAAAGLPTLTHIIGGLWLKVGPVLNLDLSSSTERLRSGSAERHHAKIVAAMASQDPDRARDALAADIAASARYIEECGVLPD